MTALVVDDSRAMRAIIARILAGVGIDAVQAADGREALARLDDTPGIELVLVDWNMPVMDGLEFLRAVRERPEYARLRVMMVTSESEQEQVRRALAAGADEYLMKPFTADILVAKLSLLDALGE